MATMRASVSCFFFASFSSSVISSSKFFLCRIKSVSKLVTETETATLQAKERAEPADLLLQGLDEGQPLLEKLSLVDNFVHLGLVFGLGLVLLRQYLLPLAQLDREALFRSLHIHSNEVAIRQSARKPNA